MALVDTTPPACGPQGRMAFTARQRKQVYMHSAIFDTGANAGSVYAPARQAAVWGEVNRALMTPSPDRALPLPKPADMKATVNSGHGVVMQQGSRPAGVPFPAACGGEKEFVQFGQAEPMRLVHANRDDSAIPREFRNTSTKLEWCDPRSERVSCRGKEKANERAGMDAFSRKHHELSSEIFGPMSVPETKKETKPEAEKTENKPPLSARGRLSHNLNCSNESQFCVRMETPRTSLPTKESKENAAVTEERRRTERNYSDLFGKPTDRKTSPAAPRTELHGTANVDFLNFHCEISSRRRDRKTPTPTSPDGRAIFRPTCASPDRACWDTRTLMDSSAEIARRRRGRAGSPDDGDLGRSAADRKRVELASGQLRQGTGAPLEPHDDGQASPTSRGLGRSQSNMDPVSARTRKLSSLASEGLF